MRFRAINISILTSLAFFPIQAWADPVVNFARPVVFVSESRGPVAVTVTLSEPATGPINVSYSVSGSATPPSDYTLTPSPIVFSTGQTSRDIVVTLVHDSTPEPMPETIDLTLTGATGATLGAAATTRVTILDDDDPTWPGDVPTPQPITAGDATTANLGSNSSGVWYDRSNGARPPNLLIVKNSPSALHRLQFYFPVDTSDGKWAPVSDWPAAGLTLRYPVGSSPYPGAPDAEDLTRADLNDSNVYICAERNNNNNGVSRLSILRYNLAGVTAASTTLDAAQEWVLNHSASNPDTVDETVSANGGLEALRWIPDAHLVGRHFTTDAGVAYDPGAANYTGHGTGLFVVGLEDEPVIYFYALKSDGTFKRVVRQAITAIQKIAAAEFDRDTGRLWLACDNDLTACGNNHAAFEIDDNPLSPTYGRFIATHLYHKPANLPPPGSSRNIEGFALAPESTCVNGHKAAFWVNDGGTPGDTLYVGSIPCGCGTDADGDGALNCEDACPNDPLRIAPGPCGCGRPDVVVPGDVDNSGAADGADIAAFVRAVQAGFTDVGVRCAADFNHDGTVNGLDAPGLAAALLGT